MDLGELQQANGGRGSLPYHPALLLSVLIYGYATGCFSSRVIERATYDSLAFRFISANSRPDHDTLATFRRRFAKAFEASFVQVLQVAREHQLSRFGIVSLDGTKIHANASRHSALSYGHAEAIEAQLKGEVQELLALAKQADGANVPDGMSLPEELKRREERLAAVVAAKTKIEERAAKRFARAQADDEAKLVARAAKAAASRRKPGGEPPKAPTPGARPEDQVNLTDEASRTTPVAGGGFEQSFNAQALVDTETMLVLIPHLTQAANDKQQLTPMLERIGALPEDLPKPQQLVADAGYFGEANVNACESAGIGVPAVEPKVRRTTRNQTANFGFGSRHAGEPPNATEFANRDATSWSLASGGASTLRLSLRLLARSASRFRSKLWSGNSGWIAKGRCTVTARFCPIRYTRSVHWSSTAGFHHRVRWMT